MRLFNVNQERKKMTKIIEARIESPVLSTAQAAVYLGLSQPYLRQARMKTQSKDHRGRPRLPGPPFLSLGRRVLYFKIDLDKWLLSHRHEVFNQEGGQIMSRTTRQKKKKTKKKG